MDAPCLPAGPPPELRTDRLVLRALSDGDAADVFAYASDPRVSEFLSWEAHRTVSDSLRFIRWAINRYQERLPAPWAVCLPDGPVIGTGSYLTVNQTHRYADIGYVLGADWWGRGYAVEVARALIGHAFSRLGLHRVEAQVRLENARSARVLEKAGMQQEAVLRGRFFIDGRFHDSRLYAAVLPGDR